MAGSTSSTSPTSASTFSFAPTSTSGSHYTSESQPDLGAGFRTVLRELTYLQPPPRIPTYNHSAQTQSLSRLRTQTEDGRRSTVWAYEPIAQYLADDAETETDTDTTRSVHIETETEIEPSSTASPTVSTSLVDDYTVTLRTQPSPPASPQFDINLESELSSGSIEGPSLGYLDQALSFIAAERAQHAARTSSQSDAWRHVVGPSSRKPRERIFKRISLFIEDDDEERRSYHYATDEDDAEGDDEHSPYHPEFPSKYQSKSTPLTPRPRSPLSPSNSPTSRGTLTPSQSIPQLQIQTQILSSSDSPFTSTSTSTPKRATRKRTRQKHRKVPVTTSSSAHPHLRHARSVPSLRLHAQEDMEQDKDNLGMDVEGVDEHTQRLVALARYLATISPDEKELLEGVERKMVVEGLRRARVKAVVAMDVGKEPGLQSGGQDEGGDEEDGEDVLDPRGRAPRVGDPPVHIFVDHSNILFGLLTYLKKHPHLTNPNLNSNLGLRNRDVDGNFIKGAYTNAKYRSQIKDVRDKVDTGTTAKTKEKEKMNSKENHEEKEKERTITVPRILTRPTTKNANSNTTTTADTNMNTNLTTTPVLPLSTNPTSNLPLTPTTTVIIPTSTATMTTPSRTETKHPTAHAQTTPIPLPSFATALLRPDGISNSSTNMNTIAGSTYITKPTPKTRTRSRSRKARKVAQAMSVTMSSSDDVVVFGPGGSPEGQRERVQKRVSLRTLGREKVGADAEANAEAEADAEADADGEGEAEVEAEVEGVAEGEGQGDGQGPGENKDEKTQTQENKSTSQRNRTIPRHMSHTALALILERGRAVGRRVVVTSSPLYQPMDTLERLGYEVRVYIRVPDLGDGMDRATKLKKFQSQKHKRHLSGGTTSGGDGSPGTSPLKATALSTSSAQSSFAAQQIQSTQPAQSTPSAPSQPAQFSTIPAARVRYREQGVDELLQLKLHQALAATDVVPPGATIVLATGDGNVGQFSEDGFLEPVRTALKRGWRVELYAWEEGLSRAWRREFGLGSEWARKGMFQIIGMEQFAASLVKNRIG